MQMARIEKLTPGNLHISLSLVIAAVLVTACAGPRAAEPATLAGPAAASPSRPLVILTRGEPLVLASRAFRITGGGSYPHLVFNAGFDDLDEVGNPIAVLPEALPQLNTDTWQVFPDGTMETIYHLKPGIVWHDGVPLEAQDFVFAWQVYANPASGTSALAPVGEMQEVAAPDSRTVNIRWRRLYPGAAALYQRIQSMGFGALPRHILEQPYAQGDFEAFSKHPFWTDEYVGLGPYRLDKWERGQEIDAVAFDQFVLGRPQIERLRIQVTSDSNAAVAALLSGDAHIALDYLLQYSDGAVLQQQWGANKAGVVLFSPVLLWDGLFQFRPDQVSTPALLDVRFRRALVHGMDKQALNDALYGGTAIVTDGLLSLRASYYAAIEPSVAKYPYDQRRAQELLGEVGLQKGTDGFYLGLDGHPFSLDIMSLTNPTWEQENTILVEGYRRMGLNAIGRTLPSALAGDLQNRSTFGAMALTGGSGFEMAMGRFSSAVITRAETHWVGSNYGAWSNPDYDRVLGLYNNTLDVPTQVQLLAQLEKIQSEEVPQIALYYTPIVTPYPAGLVGPKLRVSGNADTLFKIWEWQWTA